MYGTVYVPLDNSDHSNVSAELALGLAKRLDARLVASHAYAAALHDVRFKQMEFTLPDEYKDETELEKQRRIHDSLITRGLTLISDSYLVQWQARAAELEVPFEGRHFDGKNFEVIVKDIEAVTCDLIVLGALGQGAVRDSQIGSVCERLLRRVRIDTLVVRDLTSASLSERGAITACIDGSAYSLGGLDTACMLAAKLGKHLEIVAVGDASHLEAARRIARGHGVAASAIALDGDPVTAILAHAERTKPWLLVAGRIGADSDDAMDIGSTAERLARRAPCNVLLSSRRLAN